MVTTQSTAQEMNTPTQGNIRCKHQDEPGGGMFMPNNRFSEGKNRLLVVT